MRQRDGGEDRSGRVSQAEWKTLSKVNEQKDNVLAPYTTLSLSGSLQVGSGMRKDVQVGEFSNAVCF